MHGQIADVIKKLMKNPKCKERTLTWLRMAMDVNYDKKKFKTNKPVASNGFILNYMDVLLQLCKPFIANFEKYPNFYSKLNCFYFHDSTYIGTADKFDKLVSSQEGREEHVKFLTGGNSHLKMSGVTTNPVSSSASSLMGDEGSKLVAPNFITECFFLAHLAAYFIGGKL
mmetsp:Transcript_6584/g.10591  ORF Transcript_6584/g.10591 Transcript_6584/m.10591 type:complete len:170 (+) Transcript_6584:1382-1891(+)